MLLRPVDSVDSSNNHISIYNIRLHRTTYSTDYIPFILSVVLE